MTSAVILAAGSRIWSRPTVQDSDCFPDAAQTPCPAPAASGGCQAINYFCSDWSAYPPGVCVGGFPGSSCVFINQAACGYIYDCQTNLPRDAPAQKCTQTVR